MSTIGDRIKEQRMQAGLTLKEVADAIDVQEATVQRYESGVIKNIPIDRVKKIAAILHTTVHYLLGEASADMSLYERIRFRRNQLNMSQEDLAKAAGYSDKSSISKIEKGLVKVPMDRLAALCIPLKTSMEYLIGMTDDPEGDSTFNSDYYLGLQKHHLASEMEPLILELGYFIAEHRECSNEEAIRTASVIVGNAARKDIPELLTLYYESDEDMRQAVLTILRNGSSK